MTIRTRINLECDFCDDPFPRYALCPAPVDAAIFTHVDLRREAKAEGWIRHKREDGEQVDLRPRCAKKVQKGDAK